MREPFKCDGARGQRYAELDADLLAALPRWLESGDVADGEVLKPGRVWRWRELAVKLFEPDGSLRARLRQSPAIRAADLHFRLLPVASPRPFVALERRRARALERGMLVSEFVRGRTLGELWRDDERAVSAWPVFLAAMHTHGVFHGDFHTHNALWSGTEWVLLDLEGVRHRLRALRKQRLVVDQWARILVAMGDEPRMHELFERYRELAPSFARAEGLWDGVRRRRDKLRERWGFASLYP